MATDSNTCGSAHLARRSALAEVRAKLAKLGDILLIEDEHIDAQRLTATLRVLFGYETQIRCASTLGDAVNAVIEQKPDLVFLDDNLKLSSDASQTMPLLRGAGYGGPIIVVSDEVTNPRRTTLLADGACDVIHKDDVDSVRVTEALARIDVPAVSDRSR